MCDRKEKKEQDEDPFVVFYSRASFSERLHLQASGGSAVASGQQVGQLTA